MIIAYFISLSLRTVLLAQRDFVMTVLWSRTAYTELGELVSIWNTAFMLDACISFMAIIGLFRFLTMWHKMQQFTRVFLLAGREISFFVIMFGLTFLGFVLLGNQIFGAEMKSFSTIMLSVRTLLKMMIGDFDYEAMRRIDPEWAPAFFSLYIFFVILILVNVLLAILNTSYTNVRVELSAEDERLAKLARMKGVAEGSLRANPIANAFRFLINEVFDYRKAFSLKGIFEPVERAEERGAEIRSVELTSNPYAKFALGQVERKKKK